MIYIDFECKTKHRFGGYFKNYTFYKKQLNDKMILCPVCETFDIKRIYKGCAIQVKSPEISTEKQLPNIFDKIKELNTFVKNNFENVGKEFYNSARDIHYGLEEQKNIYGESTYNEIQELINEGINLIPLIDIDKLEN